MTPQEAAAWWRGRYGLPGRQSYTDLLRACHAMGVTVRQSDSALTCGLTTSARAAEGRHGTGDAWVISLSAGLPRRRRIFTLGHELGHVVCALVGAHPDDEERWCDRFAADLVLDETPPGERRGESLLVLLDFAEERDMGVASSYLVLRRTQGWRGSLVVVKRVGEHHVLAKTYGLGEPLTQHLNLEPGGSPFDRIGEQPARHRIPLRIGGQSVAVWADAVCTGDTVTVFVSGMATRRLRHLAQRRRTALLEELGLAGGAEYRG